MANGGSWYYLDEQTGAMVTGWKQIGGTWYYLNSSGAMVTGWMNGGGSWYYLSSSGSMATGWFYDHGAWYYFASSGAMATRMVPGPGPSGTTAVPPAHDDRLAERWELLVLLEW